jgi:PAS domain S-box-containing protein
MRFQPWPLSRYERISQLCGLFVAIISGSALIGWFTGSDTLRGFRASYIPMAPNTALLFLLLGILLTIFTDRLRRSVLLARAGALFAGVLVVARLSEYFTGADLKVDQWFFRFPGERFGLAPVGKMAFFTAITFLFFSLALFSITWSKRHWTNDVAKAMSVVVSFIGLAFSLGYLYGAPLMYGGRSIPMALNTALCFIICGAGLLVRGSLGDITERKRAEETLLKLASIVESSDDAIVSKTLEGIVTSWNKGAERIYGYNAEEVIGQPISIIIPPQHADELPQILERVKRGERVQHYDTVRARKDGQNIHISLSASPIKNAAGQIMGASVIARDVTERQLAKEALQRAHDELEMRVNERTADLTRAVASLEAEIAERKQAEQALHETEDQLRQSQKLEAIGQLAGGVAHDFNNLLTVIMGYGGLLLSRAKLNEGERDQMEEINKAAHRASALTRQLLAFSRKQVLQPEVLDLNSLVEGTGKMLRRLIGEDVEVITSLKPGVGKINADPGQIEQILMNLVVNARDAMPSGGKLTIETANVELTNTYADMHIAVQEGSYVMLAVSDTGTGMDAETQKRIFEPFFTTKEVGQGTGLGLSTIYGIVKQSGGNIWVYSEVGKGTTFKIYLPLFHSDCKEQASANEQSEGREEPATETILLVEDDQALRKLAREILEERGYRVLVAQNGEDAVEISRAHAGPINLLLTDVVMPRMNGKQVAESMSPKRQEMKILYMSGYTNRAIVHHGVLESGTKLIEKPFTAEALTSKVRHVLSNSRDTREELSVA